MTAQQQAQAREASETTTFSFVEGTFALQIYISKACHRWGDDNLLAR